MVAQIKTYRTYRFIDKDPVIDEMRTLIEAEGLMQKLDIVHQLSGVSASTLHNWFNGDTVSPQNRTICAVATALGYEHSFAQVKKIEIDKELALAKRWMEKQNSGTKKTAAAKPQAAKPKAVKPKPIKTKEPKKPPKPTSAKAGHRLNGQAHPAHATHGPRR